MHQRFVITTGNSGLEEILERYGLRERELDLLSIDIDSDDLAIWKSLVHLRPVVVVIEYNPNIPIDVWFENPRGENKGNASRSIHDYAVSIGYELVATTQTNLVYLESSKNRGRFRTSKLDNPSLHQVIDFSSGWTER